MEKLNGDSLNIVEANIERLKALFPNVFVDGKIDFEMLKILLGGGGYNLELSNEKYSFNWIGKRLSIRNSQTPSTGTLLPCKDKSVNWENTENLYIEGDNLEVLKLLQKTYYGKVKMIYIDPPYNTGHDFVYNDNFKDSINNYKSLSSQVYRANSAIEGRYHTNWLNMIYPRLLLASNLLKKDGIIFISIDDNEVTNLKKVCDEIFGENNFVAQIVVEGTPKNDPLIISTAHEYCLVYVKNKDEAKMFEWGIDNPIYGILQSIVKNAPSFEEAEKRVKQYYKDNNLLDDNISNYNKVDKYGLFRIGPIDDPQSGGTKDVRKNPYTGEDLKTPNGGWRCSLETWNKWIQNNEIFFPEDNNKLCSRKVYIDTNKLDLLRAHLKIQTRKDTDMLKNMFGMKVFSFPKPVDLIKTFIASSIKSEDIVMDFFSGSATTAHSCMLFNLEQIQKSKQGKAKFILVQLPEKLEDNLKSASGNREKQVCQNAIEYCKTNKLELVLTSIGEERIKKSAELVGFEAGLFADKVDLGFKVFKLESTNIKPWDGENKVDEQTIFDFTDTIKDDRTNLDVAYEIMLKYGIFDKPLKEVLINNKTMHDIGEGYMIICLDNDININDVTEIAKLKPHCVVFKEKGFADDNEKINATYTLERMGVEEVKCI